MIKLIKIAVYLGSPEDGTKDVWINPKYIITIRPLTNYEYIDYTMIILRDHVKYMVSQQTAAKVIDTISKLSTTSQK